MSEQENVQLVERHFAAIGRGTYPPPSTLWTPISIGNLLLLECLRRRLHGRELGTQPRGSR